MNLTRAEAGERARLLRVHSYDVTLDLTASERFRSTTVARFDCASPGADTFLDLVAPTVHELSLNGQQLDPALVFDGVRIALTGLAATNEIRVVADCSYMNTGEGMHRFVDPVDEAVYLYTQFEVADSRRVFAVFDQPDLKATFTFTVCAPSDWQVVSTSATPEPEAAADGSAVWRFPATPRLSSYVTAIVAGPYAVVRDVYEGPGGRVPLGVFCRRSLAEHLDAAEIFDVTKRGLAYYERLFDHPYPFAKYDQLFVPEFNAGAMENAGAVTILEDYVFRSKVPDAHYESRAGTILHELAHMWFGDLVTMRWWDDLWLNESFATYVSVLCQSEATRWSHAWTTFASAEKTWAYRQDQLPSTHPIVADIRDLEDVEVNFDGITYAKGASVLKQLVAWVGRDAFFEGVRRYIKAHAWGNTSLADLLDQLEETSGRDLRAWAREWLESAGVVTLRPELSLDERNRLRGGAVLQEAPAAWPTLRSQRVAVGLFDRTPHGLVRRRSVELDITGARTEVPALDGEPRPDLLLLNDSDLGYAKVRLDPFSLRTLVEDIASIEDPLARMLCWTAAWDMTRDAEMSTSDYVRLVLGGVGAEADSTAVSVLLRQVQAATQLYAAPEHRDALMALGAEKLDGLLHGAPPGSDHQLQFLRALTNVARTDAHLDLLRGLLDGAQILDGLAVDTDLRWHLLHRLVVTGRASEPEIEAELRRDDTATGARQAAGARAARPTATAKAEAWASVVDSDDLPNAVRSAVISGFSTPDHRDLLRPYVDPYFDVLDQVWATRTNETAQNIVTGLYPIYLTEPATVVRTDAWLSSGDHVPAMRRLVVEARDGVVRALRAQTKDTESDA